MRCIPRIQSKARAHLIYIVIICFFYFLFVELYVSVKKSSLVVFFHIQ